MHKTLLALAVGASAALAQGWAPEGPIKLIIAFAAGGGADTQARLIAEALEETQGWEVVPEQVTGAGGAVAANALVGEPADGTVIAMLVTETLGYNMVAGQPGYDLSDFTPLTTTAGFQMGVVATTERGIASMDEAFAAAAEGGVRFGAMSPKLADLAYLLGQANGVDFNIVELQGGRAVVDALNAGDLDIGFAAGIQARAVAAGDMVNLASALSTPLGMSPEAPTFADLGVPFNADGHFMFAAPAGLPEEARAALTDAIVAAATNEAGDVRPILDRAFGGPAIIRGADLEAFLANQVAQAEALLDAVSE